MKYNETFFSFLYLKNILTLHHEKKLKPKKI